MSTYNVKDHTIRESIELSYATKDVTPATMKTTETFIHVCEKYFKDGHLPNSPLEVYKWIKDMRADNLSPITVHGYFKRLKAVMRTLYKLYDAEWFMDKVDTPKIPDLDHRIWSNDEIYKIITVGCVNDLDRAIITTLIDSTCRIGGLSSIVKENIDLKNGTVKTQEKTEGQGAYQIHRLDPKIGQALLDLCPPTTSYVFSLEGIDLPFRSEDYYKNTSRLGSRVRTIVKRAGITGKKIGAHTFRHTSTTAITELFSGDEQTIMQFTGHKSSKSLKGYIHRKDQVNTIGKFSPLEAMVENSDFAKDQRKTQETSQYMMIETSDGETIEVENTPTIWKDPQTNAPNQDRIRYYELQEQNIPDIPEGKVIRPSLNSEDFTIIKQAIIMSLKAGALGAYSGQAIQLLQRMTKFVK